MAGADRITAARERLASALLVGEDTRPFREALAALEQAAQREEEQRKTIEAEQEEARRRWINARAHALADEISGDLTATLARFPIPSPDAVDPDKLLRDLTATRHPEDTHQ
jgi:hypothetical protein